MKNKLKIMAAVALMGCLGIASFSHAQTTTDLTEQEAQVIERMREKREEMKLKMQEELGLTEEQQQKLEEHRDAHRSQNKVNRETMDKLHEQLKAEVEKEEIDTATITSIHEQIKALDNQIADHRLEGMLEIREILTPEQFKKFHEKFGKGKGPRGRGHGGKHGGGKGGFFKGGRPEFDSTLEEIEVK